MVIIGLLVVVVACLTNRILAIESSEISIHQLPTDHTCDVSDVIHLAGPARSLLECAVGCLEKSNLCYNNGTSTCTCCSATNPSGPSTTNCYRRQDAEPEPEPETETCPDDWTTTTGGLSLYAHSVVVDFTECKNVCNASCAKILTPENLEQISDALTFLAGKPGTLAEEGRYWLGMVANTTEPVRPFYYSDTGNLVTYFNWNSPDQPNGITTQNCINMRNTGKWSDSRCDQTRSCVCQI